MSDERRDIPELIRKSWDSGSPTDWFEEVYSSAVKGQGRVPWAYMAPNPEMVDWMDTQQIKGEGKRALVIGCGLGDDAEFLAEWGFEVTAFDISPTAVHWCKQRFPESSVTYTVADLLAPPDEWAFDFVLESRTVQSLPYDLAGQALTNIAGFVGTGGTLLLLCHGRGVDETPHGIPWALSRKELAVLEQHGLHEDTFEDYSKNGLRRFRVVYRR